MITSETTRECRDVAKNYWTDSGDFEFLDDVGDGLGDGVEEARVGVTVDEALFVDHVGETVGGGAEGVEEGHGLVEVGDAVGEG